MPAKKTHEEFVNEMKSIAPDIMIIGKYNGRHESIEVMCRNCGKRWSPTAGDLLSGKGCRQCRIKKFSDSRKKTNEDFVSELYLLNPNVRPLEQYVNSHTKIKTQCLICGNIWMITPKDLLHGYGCRKCYIKKSSENRRYTSEEYFKKASALNPV
ncbi:MAG: hypothetical protein E7241_08895 [Lachnospiraceae bacterium]|nr:hypothetical protein [Lachnospiraceae bacterium]